MKMDMLGWKKKKRAKDQTEASSAATDPDAVVDRIVAGVSSNLDKATSTAKKLSPHDNSAVDIIVDSDEDEIFDDDDDDDVAGDASEAGDNMPASSQIDYRDMLAAGASAIVAPIQKVVNNAVESHDEESQRTGNSYHSSESEEEEEDAADTESDDDDDEKANSKDGGGSDSGEDYTDDEDEGEDGYRPGGYHPVKIGEVYNQR